MKRRRVLSALMAAVLMIGTIEPTLPTVAAEGEPLQLSEDTQELEVYEEPAEVYEEPAEAYEEPAEVYEEPAEVYEEPAEVYEEPAETYEEPTEIYEESSEVYEEPVEVYEEPAEVPAEEPTADEAPEAEETVPDDSFLTVDEGAEIAVPVVDDGEIIIEDVEWIEEDPEEDEDEKDEFGIEIEAITEVETEDEIMTLAAGETGAFAVYSADDSSLTFYYGEEPEEGTEYNGKTVTQVYTGFEKKTYSSSSLAPWSSNRNNYTSVVIDKSFSEVQPTAMAYWFYDFTNCVEFIGLENIDTSCVTTMQDLFCDCQSVTSLDITSWDTSSVTNMAQMIYRCPYLASLKISGIDVSNVKEMNGMIRTYGDALTELDLSGFDPISATKVNAMLRDNYSLTTIYADRDWDLSNVSSGTNGQNMFANDYPLVGGNGTAAYSGSDGKYTENSLGVNYNMARIDRDGTAGYFTDSRVLELVNISGTKVWDDANDQDGIRPESITINLLANGEPATDENGDPISMTVTAEDDWSFTFSDEPKYDGNFDEITYTITENEVAGYESEITGGMEKGFVITNSYTPELTDISGTITWDDGNNQDGKRPSFVSVQLFAKDSEGGTLKTWNFEVHAPETPIYDNEENEVWTWTMEGLDQYYDGGQGVKYTVICTGVDLDVYEQANPDDLNTIYSYTPETTTVSGSKTWVDDDNSQGTRPDEITIRLHGNNEVVDSQVVTAEEGWGWTFDDLPVYDSGHEIHYTITEDAVDDYVAEYDGYNVTNTLHAGETSVTVIKDWEDENDQDGIRPDSITVDLLADSYPAVDENGNAVTLTLTDNGAGIWEGTFEVAANSEGRKIDYTIKEPAVTDKNGNADSYKVAVSGDAAEGFTVTNSYTPEMIDSISGEKIWEDADDQDGMRPSSIYIHLMANGTAVDGAEVTADANGEWTFTFADMPKCANGTEIKYSVEEVLDETAADAYTASYSGEIEDGFKITNTHTPEQLNGDGELTVTKVWDDDDDRDGLRPESVTVHLLENGEKIDSAVLPDDENEWTASFTGLPKYAEGKEIIYTVSEDDVKGYTAAVTGSVSEGYTITNTHTPATINVNVAKIWEDEEDQDGKRPVFITVNLLADGEPALDKNGDAIRMVINESDDWEDPFTNLYQYRDGGTEIIYKVEEDTTNLEGIYTTKIEGNMTDGFTITNSYTPELYNGDGTFKVVLVWDDEANNDGIRPESVHLTLTKNNTMVEGEELTLTAEDADENGYWVGTFENLPKYENGEEIVYSINEDVYSGYTYRIQLLTDEKDGLTYVQLTNVHVSVKEDIEITKVWDDADNQDGKRPESITVNLMINGSLYKQRTLTADTEGVDVSEGGKVWTYTMSDIPVDKNGEAIEYTVLEVAVENYGTPQIETIRGEEVTDNGVTYQPYSFVVTNSHTPEQVTVSGTKVWDDAANQDGKRPQYVKLNLLADSDVVESIDVTTDNAEGNNENVWDWTFSAHDKYKDGKEIEYTVTEEEVTGYDTEITGSVEDGFTIMNSYTPERTTISGSKTWVDDDNADNIRPESITVRLHANGNEEVYEKTVTSGDGWAWEFTDVPVYSNGKHIDYTLTEDAVDNYDTTYTFGDDGTLNVTNTLSPGNTSLTVEKDWEDNDNQDGIRPTEVTVELLRDGTATGDTLTLSDADHWTDTFHNLQEYEGGVRIDYAVQEVSVDGYDSKIEGDVAKGYTITNIHDPEKIKLSGSKVWNDADDQDGIRPDHITIHLMSGEETLESHTVSAENDWTFTFSDLDKYANGEEISYTIEEAYTAEGYEAAVDGYTVTNTHTPEVIDITGTKTWDDDDNRDGIRPTEITISLYAGDDFVVSETVTADDNWTFTFTGLDKYAGGKEIDYSVEEDVPDGYHASYNYFDYDVTNTHAPELLNGDGTLGVIMRWDDEGDQDGLRPKRTTITLMLNGVRDETITLVLSDDNVDENGNWIGSFTDLYKYANGEEIEYNVEEGVMNGYTYTAELLYDEDTDLCYVEITNTHAAVTSDITVTKVWDDNNNQDGIRSDSIVVNLFSNGSAVKSVTLTPGKEGVTVSGDGNEWSYTFEGMPVDQNGEAIIYTLDEVDVGSYSHRIDTTTSERAIDYDGYEFSYTQYEFTVTNSHTPETAEVNGKKVWDDAEDQDGLRPHSITIELLADGVPALDENGEEITQLVTPHTDGSWTWTFTDIPKYRDVGTEIVYSFEEFAVDEYTTTYSEDGLTITNTHETATRTISGNKEWNDDNDAQNTRPENITVNLYANGLVKESKTISENDGWTWTFEGLPVNENGKPITYITTETAIDDYDTTYSGFTLTNTLAAGKTSVTVAKDWEDADDQDGIRPESVTVKLFADGVATGETLTLSESDNWEDTFHELPIYEEGKRIVYSIEEEEVEGYTCKISGDASDGFEIINTHEPETIKITGSKTWDDAEDQDGLRPEQIIIHLFADETEVLTEEVYPDYDWTFELTDLPKYDAGQEITYMISETAVTGYETTITGNAEEGFEIVNTHTPETIAVSGTKVWQDADDQDGLRPENITINLLANGSPALDDEKPITLTLTGDETSTWAWTFDDLPKYAYGEAIEYTIEEEEVDGYDSIIAGDAASGFIIINSHTPEILTITGSKTWNDDDNQDGSRPGSVTIRLHRNGEVIAARTVTAYDGWAWTFSNEPKYANRQEIVYTITEDPVDDYSAEIDGYDVTNSYTVDISTTIDWEDDDNQDGLRPKQVTVNLIADGVVVKSEALSEDDGWAYTFTDLPKYADGREISYSAELVDNVGGYTIDVNGDTDSGYEFVLTPTYEPFNEDGRLEISVDWEDDEDADHLRPESITIRLLANGEEIDTITLSEQNNWTASFTNLLRYAYGQEIEYTVEEADIDGYKCEAELKKDDSGHYYIAIVNTHEPAQTETEPKQTETETKQSESEQTKSEPKTKETEPKTKETESEKMETEPAAEKPSSTTTSSSLLLLRGTARSKTKIDLDWTKVKGADGYILYSAKCGEKMQKTAVIEGRKNNTYTMKKLEPNTAYKFRVKAYKIENGKRVTLQKSFTVHLYTKGKGGKYTNVKKVKVSTKNVKLRVGEKQKVKASATLVNSSRKLKGHMDYISYVSTDTSVAKVNKNGKITAVGKGTCYVYAYAADGARKKITVTVKKAK